MKLQNTVSQEIVNNEILVIWCSKYIMFSKIDLAWLKTPERQRSKLKFTKMNIEFKPTHEILRIQGTSYRN